MWGLAQRHWVLNWSLWTQSCSLLQESLGDPSPAVCFQSQESISIGFLIVGIILSCVSLAKFYRRFYLNCSKTSKLTCYTGLSSYQKFIAVNISDIYLPHFTEVSHRPPTDGMGECRKCQFSSLDVLVQQPRSPEDGQNSGHLFYQQTLRPGSRGTPHNGHTYRQLYQHLKFAQLSVLSWLVSRNCSLATLRAHLYVILFVLIGSPASAAPLSSETWLGAGAPKVEVACSGQFFHRLRSCVQPFLSSVGEQQLTRSLTLGEHLCLKYQLALLCVHSLLTECPGVDNVRQVQTILGSHRVVQINHLCSIASQNHKHSVVGDETALRHHRQMVDVAGTASSGGRPGALVQSIMTTSHVHVNNLHTTVTHPPNPCLATSAGPVSTTQEPSRDHRPDSGSHDVPLNIHDFVNNYQFHKSPVVDTGGSSNSLFQIVVATSAGDTTRLHLSLLLMVFVGLILIIH